HSRAGPVVFGGGQPRRAGPRPIVAACRAQRLERAEPAHIALAPRRHAVAQPMLLGDDLAVELVLCGLLLGQHLVAPGLEAGEAALDAAGCAPGGAARPARPGGEGTP